MKKTLSLVLVVIFLSSALISCDKNAELNLGELQNGKYVNDYFGFEISIDENYTFLTQDEILDIRKSAVDDEVLSDEEVKLHDQPVIYYLYALKYPVSENVPYNPYISVYSENLDTLEKVIKTKEDYISYNMDFAVAVFNASGYAASASNIDKLWYDDRQFGNSILTVDFGEVIMKKEMFTILKGRYAINIVLGYNTIEDREELMTFLDTIKIQK